MKFLAILGLAAVAVNAHTIVNQDAGKPGCKNH